MSKRIFKVVGWQGRGLRQPITYRIWCDVPIRKGKFHLSTAHYKTKEAAEAQINKYQFQEEVA